MSSVRDRIANLNKGQERTQVGVQGNGIGDTTKSESDAASIVDEFKPLTIAERMAKLKQASPEQKFVPQNIPSSSGPRYRTHDENKSTNSYRTTVSEGNAALSDDMSIPKPSTIAERMAKLQLLSPDQKFIPQNTPYSSTVAPKYRTNDETKVEGDVVLSEDVSIPKPSTIAERLAKLKQSSPDTNVFFRRSKHHIYVYIYICKYPYIYIYINRYISICLYAQIHM
jgi:hypothetical protein